MCADVKNLEESQRIFWYIVCLPTTMQDSLRFFKDSLHFYTLIRQIESVNLGISWRILENPWESLKSAQNFVCLEIIEIQWKNPEESSSIDASRSSINDHGRVDCVKHTFTLGAALIRNFDEGCEDVHDALVLDSIYLFLSDSFIVPQLRVCCCCNIRRFFMFSTGPSDNIRPEPCATGKVTADGALYPSLGTLLTWLWQITPIIGA